MNSADAPAEIVAALIWDVPRLQAGSPSARDFSAALPGQLERWWEPREYGDDVLGRAAKAVAYERANEPEEAAKLYATLAAEQDLWPRLLGLMLLAWSESEEGTEAITDARAVLEEIDPPADLTARLLAKLVTYAFDEGAVEMGKELLGKAIELAPEQTRLRRALAIEGLNVGLSYEWKENEPPLAPDPLVDYPWIEFDVLGAAQGTLAGAVEAHSRRLWTFQWSAGKTPLDDAVAAEVQATWAGALWMRRPIRKQLGAQLLTGAARTATQWGYGVVMWALGAGKSPERAYALAEPMLDQDASDFIVRALADAEISPRYGHRFLSVAAEAWHSVSDEVFRWVIKRVPPVAGDHPTFREAQRIWAGYAARFPNEWLSSFKDADESVRVSLLEMLGTHTVTHMSDDGRNVVYETAKAALLKRPSADTQLLRVLAAAAPTEPDEDVRRAVAEKASASAIATLVYEEQGALLSKDSIAQARTKLIDALREETQDARKGTISFGPEDVRMSLGRLIAGTRRNAEAVELLTETALDPTLPSEHLLHARNGLTLVRRAGKLTPSEFTSLRQADDPPGILPEHGDISAELLRASRLRILALDLTSDEVVLVVSACRAQDAKVRQIALDTCAEAVGAPGDPADRDALAWGLIGGLFDPSDEVVASAVGGVTREFIGRFPAAGRVAIERFPRLLDESIWPVRAAVNALARELAKDGELAEDPILRGILDRAQEDRSWLVRTASA